MNKVQIITLKPTGSHVTTASKLMGDANPMVTLKIYTQVIDDEAHLAGIELARYIKA